MITEIRGDYNSHWVATDFYDTERTQARYVRQYVKNHKHGVWSWYNWDGNLCIKIMEQHYKDDKLHGVCTNWSSEDGSKIYECVYEDNVLVKKLL